MTKDEILYTGLIETECDKSLKVYVDNQRCLEIIQGRLDGAIGLAKDMGAVGILAEAKGGSKSAKANSMMAMAQAVVSCKAHSSGLPLRLILAGAAKKVATGDRKASKGVVRAAMDKRYPEALEMMQHGGFTQKGRQEHIFDAMCVGYAILSS